MPDWLTDFFLLAPTAILAILVVVGWFCRHSITTFLTASIRHGFDKKLEELRAALREQNNAMESLRSGAMAVMLGKQTVLAQRRIKAVEQIWDDIIILRNARVAVGLIANLPPNVLEQMMTNTNLKEFTFGSLFSIDGANKYLHTQPFVPPMAWALVNAYRSIVVAFATAADTLKQRGADEWNDIAAMLNTELLKKMIKEALPEDAKMIDDLGHKYYYECLGKIDKKLLDELTGMLEGKDADEKSAQQAARIMKHADEIGADKIKKHTRFENSLGGG